MKISELTPDTKKAEATGTIFSMGAPVDGAGWIRCNAILKDNSGQIKLVLWNEDIPKVNEGDTIKIENGYVKDYKGTLQLSTGKYGKLTVIEKGKVPQPTSLSDKPLLLQIAEGLEYEAEKLLEMAKDCRKQTK